MSIPYQAGYQSILLKLGTEDLGFFEKRQKKLMDALAGVDHPYTSKDKRELLLSRLLRKGGVNPSQFVYNVERIGVGPGYIPRSTKLQRRLLSKDDPLYVPEGKQGITIDAGRNPLVYGHEVGHATPVSTRDKIIQRASWVARNPAAVLPPIYSGILGAATRKFRYPIIGTGLAALGGGLNIAEEVRATKRGRELLNAIGYVPSEHEEQSQQKALNTYIKGALFGLTLPWIAHGVSKRFIHF